MTLFSRRILLFLVLSLNLAVAPAQDKEPLLVFGASSLTDTLQKVSDAYTRSTGTPVKLSFAASSALAKQIESGARADIFMSADLEWMDYLEQKQLLKANTRQSLLGNRLALIAPSDSKAKIRIAADAPLAAALGANGRLATGDPDSVPVGKYAKAALTSLNLWDSLQSRIARAENVRVALTYVARGEAPLGIVYETDAKVEPKVRIVDLFPESSHPSITYPVAAVRTARAGAESFLTFLRTNAATSVFTAAGFTMVDARPAAAACSDFKFDVSEELKLFAGTASAINAAAAPTAPPTLDAKRLYEVSLMEQAKVAFREPPSKTTVNEGSYAGILRIAAGRATTLRVSLSEAAWIDVLDGMQNLETAQFSGSHTCNLIRKNVEFKVQPGRALLLQLSGSTESAVKIAISN